MSRKIHVGVLARVFMDWSGGVDLIIYIANAIALNNDYTIHLLVPDNHEPLNIKINNESDLNRILTGVKNRFTYRLRLSPRVQPDKELDAAFSDLDNKIKVEYYRNTELGFLQCINKLGLDVIIPSTAPLGIAFPVPWVGYIWDFQHRHLPQYFDKNQIEGRDVIFKEMLEEAPAILLNSLAVKEDVRKEYPGFNSSKKLFALPFAPYPATSWLTVDSAQIIKKYSLPKKYFIISNQFWIHKDHPTAIKAMAEIVNKNPSVHLVCTGKMEEPRKPTHISELQETVQKLGLNKNIHFLGFIPKNDQVALLRAAIALVQPTLYEGGPGGGASYNAIALGVPVIASDIPVNLEMKNENVTFFKAGNAKDLATKMLNLLSKTRAKPPTNKQLLSSGKIRLARLSESLAAALNSAIENWQ